MGNRKCIEKEFELFPLELLAKDINESNPPQIGKGFGGITLTYNVEIKEEVNHIIELVRNAGGSIVKEPQEVLYIMSIKYFPDFTTFVAIIANTYSYLKEKVGENEKYYTYYKYCEEWELGECLEVLSKDLQAEYKEMEEKYDDEQFDELQTEHVEKIFSICKTVMKKFKETDTHMKLPNLYLNVYIRERFTKEEIIQTFCELNGEDSIEEYLEWL